MRDRSREVGIFAAGLVVGVVLALLVPFVMGRLAGLAGDGDDPLDHVTVVDPTFPIAPDLSAVVRRLDRTTDATWQVEVRERSTVKQQPSTLTPAVRAELEKWVTVPDGEKFELLAVATNLGSPKSVRKHGAFYLVALSRQAPAERWLREDRRIFADDAQEDERETYQAGSLIFYYAPTGQVDHSADIRRYVGEVVRCPNDAGACPE